MPGGAVYEPKWDGYRIVAVRDDSGVRLWSRQGKDLTSRFPDLAEAVVSQVQPGTVIDAEAVIWNRDRLDFDLLQRRLVSATSSLPGLVAKHPASLMVFDILAHRGSDLRGRPLRDRREVLEELAGQWRPPLQLSLSTTDEATARAWFVDYRPAGVEGLVVKGRLLQVHPGATVVGEGEEPGEHRGYRRAVTGSLTRPETVVAGRIRDGVLHIVGKTTPLSRTQAADLAVSLTAAGPEHPWPDEVSSTRFGSSREKVKLAKVEPLLVAEVLADTALQAGAYRHPLRFVRLRRDLSVGDLDP